MTSGAAVEHHPFRSRAQRLEVSAVVTDTLGEQTDGLTILERSFDRGKHLGVARRVDSRVAPSVDRNRTRVPHEQAHRMSSKECRLRQESNRPPRRRLHHGRIEQRVGVIGHQQQRAVGHRAAEPLDAIERPDGEASKAPDPRLRTCGPQTWRRRGHGMMVGRPKISSAWSRSCGAARSRRRRHHPPS